MSGVTVVNVVGSGSINTEFDLGSLHSDIGEPEADYDPEKYPGMYLRFENQPTVTLYRTGKYIIYGADRIEKIESARRFLLTQLTEIGAIESPEDSEFGIQNVVCTGELEEEVNLNAVTIGLGLNRTEYEPEQFPGVIYRPDSGECVILIFGSGKTVIAGGRNKDVAQRAFDDLKEQLKRL